MIDARAHEYANLPALWEEVQKEVDFHATLLLRYLVY
jgi:hypothetical protein